MKSYSEKLKDPRWQKKRLEILERDDFTCQQCGNKGSTLNVHHIVYHKDHDPWEYNNEELITLCEVCHESERDLMYRNLKELNDTLKAKFKLSQNIETLSMSFCQMETPDNPSVLADVIMYFLSDKKNIKLISDKFDKESNNV